MGSVTLSQTNLEAHDQIWSFLNKEQLEDLEGSVCDDFSLNSEELYEEASSELSEQEGGSQVFDSLLDSPVNDPFDLEFNSSAPQSSNDFSDLVPHLELYNDNFLLEVQESTNLNVSVATDASVAATRKRSICQIELSLSSPKKPKSVTDSIPEVEKLGPTKAKNSEEDFVVDSDEEVLLDGSNSLEQKLTKMISQLGGRQLEKALEIMSENVQLSSTQRAVFDLSKMNQSKLLKLHEYVSKCNSFDIIDDDIDWSDEASTLEVDSLSSTPLCSPPNTRPSTPSLPSVSSSRMSSPSPFLSSKSIFSQNKAKEERLKDILSASQSKVTKKNPAKKVSKTDDEEIDILS